MASHNEKMLLLCMYEYLIQKGLNESALVFQTETGLQQDDLAIHPGFHFFTDWWDRYYEVYFIRGLDNSTSIQNPLPEVVVTMPSPNMSFFFSSSSVPHQSISVGLKRQNPPPMFGSYGMPNSSQPIAGLSSSGDRVQSSSTSMKEPSDSGGTGRTNADIDNSANNGPSLVMTKYLGSTFGQLKCCNFSTKGDMLACVTEDKTVVVWITTTHILATQESQNSRSNITDVCFVPDTDYVAASSLDKVVEIWDANKPSLLRQKHFRKEAVVSMEFNPSNSNELCCAVKEDIRLWNVIQDTTEILFPGAARQVRYKPGDGNLLAVLSTGNKVGLFDVRTRASLFFLQGHEKEVHTICWDVTGQHIASVSEDEARVWAINLGIEPIYQIKSTGKGFYSCTAHPEMSQAFIIGSDQTLEVWTPCIRNDTESINAHNGIVSALCTSSRAGLIASTSNDYCLKLWRTK